MKTTFTFIFILFFSFISLGQTYQKVSPTPSEVNYNDIAFADSLNVWVIGEKGTMLHSTDRGEKWEVLPNITDVNFKKIFFQDPNNGWIVGGKNGTGIKLQTFDGGSNWSMDTISENSINDIIINENGQGWMVGDHDFLLKTTDNGITWNPISIGTGLNFNSVYFLNDSIGWLASEKILWYTINGGANWQYQDSVVGQDIKDVFFINNNYGWAVGNVSTIDNNSYNHGLVLTEDGGNTWSAHLTNTILESVIYLNEQQGWITGSHPAFPISSGRAIYHTTDTNIPSFQNIDYSISRYISLPSGTLPFKQVVEDRNEIWMVGGRGVILKKGINDKYWDCKTNVTNNLFAVQYVTAQVAWAVGHRGIIIKSIDGGITWEEEPQFTDQTLLDLVFVNETIGYTVGSKGEIWKTINGGNDWILQQTNITQYLKSTTFINENKGWAVGDDGVILQTNNGGELWNIQHINDSMILNSVQFLNDSIGFVIGTAGVFLRTIDGGENWKTDSVTYSNINSNCNLTDLHFFEKKNGMITFGNGFYDRLPTFGDFTITPNALDMSNSSCIFNTTNGSNWDLQIDSFLFGQLDVFGNLEKGINSIKMFDRNNGIMAGRRVFVSKGDSLNWERLDIPNEDIASTWQDIDCYDKNNCLVVGINGNILKLENDYILTENNNIKTTPAKIKVFPNPTDGKVICQNIEKINRIHVFDFQGRLIKQISVEKNTFSIEFSLEHFTAGIYLLNFIGEEKMQSVKVVLQ